MVLYKILIINPTSITSPYLKALELSTLHLSPWVFSRNWRSLQIELNGGTSMVQWWECSPSYCYGWGLIPGPAVTCEWSLILVLVVVPRGFSPWVFRFSSLHNTTTWTGRATSWNVRCIIIIIITITIIIINKKDWYETHI